MMGFTMRPTRASTILDSHPIEEPAWGGSGSAELRSVATTLSPDAESHGRTQYHAGPNTVSAIPK